MEELAAAGAQERGVLEIRCGTRPGAERRRIDAAAHTEEDETAEPETVHHGNGSPSLGAVDL